MKKSFYCFTVDQVADNLDQQLPPHMKLSNGKWMPKIDKDGILPEIKKLKLSELIIDREYQRTLSVSQLLSYGDFNSSLLNPITVVIRPDGTKSVVDGQHSCAFVRKATDDPNYEVDCRVFDKSQISIDDCLKFEANLYKTLNKNRKPTGDFESLKAGVILGDPESLLFDKYLRSVGLKAENLGSQNSSAREFRPQKTSSQKFAGDAALKIGQFIKCFRRHILNFREEMTSAIGIVKAQTKGEVDDRMILVTTAIITFLEYGSIKGKGKISSSSNHTTYNHFHEWLQNNMNNLTWAKSGDDLGYRCMHIIMKNYEDYVKNLPIEQRPRRTLKRSDLNYNGFFHPDEKPSKKDWEELYRKGKVVGDKTNTLKNFK